MLLVSSLLLTVYLLAEDSGQAKRAKAEVETKAETENTEPVSSTSSTVALSEPLAKFFGTVETEMTEEEIIRRVWEYIKLNNLEVSVESLWFLLCFFTKFPFLLPNKSSIR